MDIKSDIISVYDSNMCVISHMLTMVLESEPQHWAQASPSFAGIYIYIYQTWGYADVLRVRMLTPLGCPDIGQGDMARDSTASFPSCAWPPKDTLT